jgi:ElaB/YqjD/DUF883 family membrane-anchored ribosome-binding protein
MPAQITRRMKKAARRMVVKAQRTVAANTRKIVKAGKMRTRQAVRAVDTSVNKNPWQYIAGFAAGAAAVGYLCGRRRHAI